jgi:uncharacterized membrane protein YgdD (TMEM256/DUF423 family)
MLLFHAAAVVGVVAALDRGLLSRTLGLLAAAGLAIGAILFAGDVTLPIYFGFELFPAAAPAGGILMIASWVAVAVAAAIPPARAPA